MVIAVLYGVPDWTRRSCSQAVAPIFCGPTELGSKYMDYLFNLLHYFNGENGNGRIADFVIHNEVNAIE